MAKQFPKLWTILDTFAPPWLQVCNYAMHSFHCQDYMYMYSNTWVYFLQRHKSAASCHYSKFVTILFKNVTFLKKTYQKTWWIVVICNVTCIDYSGICQSQWIIWSHSSLTVSSHWNSQKAHFLSFYLLFEIYFKRVAIVSLDCFATLPLAILKNKIDNNNIIKW